MVSCPLSVPAFLAPEFLDQQLPHCSIHSMYKRSLDIIESVIGLLVFALVFIPIAVAIKLDSEGSIFYTQKCCGLRDRPFYIHKLRSMQKKFDALKAQVENGAKGIVLENKHNSHITEIGRFLRRASLDELPQFWNVVRGGMSLVGTCSPAKDEVVQYQDHHWQRLNAKLDITGERQTSGRSNVNNFKQIVNIALSTRRSGLHSTI